MGDGSTITLINSTLSGNTATGDGGGIDAGGLLTLVNSTVTGNRAGEQGGGLWNDSPNEAHKLYCRRQ